MDENLPLAISQLKLNSALKNCGKKRVAEAFKSSVATHIWAYDQKGKEPVDWSEEPVDWSITGSEEQKSLKIINPLNAKVCLIPLDYSVITGPTYTTGGVADCLLLTEKEFCLVEFKTNASSHGCVSTRINEGGTQLWHTYNEVLRPCCAAMNIDIEKKVSEITFQIVFNQTLLNEASATIQTEQLKFTEKHLFLLVISRQKTFK